MPRHTAPQPASDARVDPLVQDILDDDELSAVQREDLLLAASNPIGVAARDALADPKDTRDVVFWKGTRRERKGAHGVHLDAGFVAFWEGKGKVSPVQKDELLKHGYIEV